MTPVGPLLGLQRNPVHVKSPGTADVQSKLFMIISCLAILAFASFSLFFADRELREMEIRGEYQNWLEVEGP